MLDEKNFGCRVTKIFDEITAPTDSNLKQDNENRFVKW